MGPIVPPWLARESRPESSLTSVSLLVSIVPNQIALRRDAPPLVDCVITISRPAQTDPSS